MSSVLPQAFVRYRFAFDDAFYAFCTGYSGKVSNMVSYHLGWMDKHGNPLSARHTVGKAIRPMLLLLTADAVGGNWQNALPAAIAVEILHNGTLIIDDIQDKDIVRHHRPTVWKLYGNAQAINAGIWAMTLQSLSSLTLRGRYNADLVLEIQEILSLTILGVLEGQWMDLDFASRSFVSINDYRKMIAHKTGVLIENSITIGAKLGMAGATQLAHLHTYASNMGVLFQIMDDFLDIWGDIDSTGKSERGTDIRRRKWTFPIVYAFEHGSQAERTVLETIWHGTAAVTDKEFNAIMDILDSTHTYQQSHTFMLEHLFAAERAIKRSQLSQPFIQDFVSIAEFLGRRAF